MKKTKRQDKQG